MKIEQSFTVSHAAPAVWAFLGDPRAVAACLAGAEVTRADVDGTLEGKMSVRFGPIQAAFSGEAQVTRDEAAMTGRIGGQGLDQRSRSQCKGVIDYAVRGADGGTAVALEVDYTLAGSLAQFSRGGLVNDLATRLTQDFAKALEAALESQAPVADDAAPKPPSDPPPREALDAGGLLGAVLWARIKGFFARLFGGG